MIKTLLLALCALSAQAQNWSLGMSAALTSWNTGFHDLQTPGWNTAVHPGGIIDLQYKHVYAEIGGDPHRPREASSMGVGLRGDLFHKGPVAIFGQVSSGVFMAPSFLEYCWSYEYQDGNCGAGALPPEYCWWFSLNAGAGVRIRLKKNLWLEPARAEVLGVYGIGDRFRFSTGLRFGL